MKTIIAMLEARGVSVNLENDNLILAFPEGYTRDPCDDALVEELRANKVGAIAYLHQRADEKQGFSIPEHVFETVTLETSDIREAVTILEAVHRGAAALVGKVTYDPRFLTTIITYRPLVPPDWINLPTHGADTA